MTRAGLAALIVCAVGFAASALVWRDYARFEAFYWDRSAELEIRGAFRPSLEMMAMSSGMFPRRPETLRQEITLIERAMHAYPKPELLCRYASALYAGGRVEEADTVMARMQIAFPTAACMGL